MFYIAMVLKQPKREFSLNGYITNPKLKKSNYFTEKGKTLKHTKEVLQKAERS